MLPPGSNTCAVFDVVAANILRGPLLELQPRLAAYCKPGGMLVLSGILEEQVGGGAVAVCVCVCVCGCVCVAVCVCVCARGVGGQ